MSALSVHKKSEFQSLDEVLKISTGPWGLQSVIKEFENFITEIIGEEKMQQLKTEYRNEYKNLIYSFTDKWISPSAWNHDGKITVLFPRRILGWIEKDLQKTVEDISTLFRYSKQITILQDKIRWDKEDFRKFGDKVIKKVIGHIKAVLAGDMEDVETILVFGRLFENVCVQNAVRENFKTKSVVALRPFDVLRGAVHIGHIIGK